MVASFHEIIFPTDISVGALGGPEFKTTILGLGSGSEKRNIEWARQRGSWDVGTGLRRRYDDSGVEGFSDFIAFFYARMGRAYGFRFRDWSDYTIDDASLPQSWTVGDGSPMDLTVSVDMKSYSLFKIYSSFTQYYRQILKPSWAPDFGTSAIAVADVPLTRVAGTYVGGVYTPPSLTAGLWSFDPTTGTIHLGTALVAAQAVTHTYFEFEVPVRFDQDKLSLNMAAYEAGQWEHIPIIELKDGD